MVSFVQLCQPGRESCSEYFEEAKDVQPELITVFLATLELN